MKKILLAATLILSLCNFKYYGNENEENKYGFRDLKFEASIDSVIGMKLIDSLTDGEMTYYFRKNDTLKIGNYNLQYIHYGFYDKKLAQIIIKTIGYKNSDGVLEILRYNYGPPLQPNEFEKNFYWKQVSKSVLYDENEITNDAFIYFSSNALEDKIEADKIESDKKATGL